MFFININMNNIVLHHMFNDEGAAHVRQNMELSCLLRHPHIIMCHWSGVLGFMFCTRLTNYDTIINTKVEHLEYFDDMFANHALFGDGAVALCPFGVRTFDGPHLWAVVYRPNICYIFVYAHQDVRVRYVIGSYNCRGNNALLFLVAYESICFAVDTIPIMSQNITC